MEKNKKLLEAKRVAIELFNIQPDWISFHRALFGVDGEIIKLFPSERERELFNKTEEFQFITSLLEKLRQNSSRPNQQEPIRIITVRIPRSLHESLKKEAEINKTSINKLCINKLAKV